MHKFIFLWLLGSVLTACSALSIHRLEVEQGNIMNSATIDRLHQGMSEKQVKDMLGTPILVNILDTNRLLYVYTFQIGSCPRVEKQLRLIFYRSILQNIQRQDI